MDLSPEGINKAHGKSTWTCWECKSDKKLHWWNGVSVACCNKQECAQAVSSFMRDSQDVIDAQEAYTREYYGFD